MKPRIFSLLPFSTGKADLPAAHVPEAFGLELEASSLVSAGEKSAATLRFALPVSADVSLVIYTITGRKVAPLVEGRMSAGYHTVSLDATTLPAGLYFCRLQAWPTAEGQSTKSFVATKRFLSLKRGGQRAKSKGQRAKAKPDAPSLIAHRSMPRTIPNSINPI